MLLHVESRKLNSCEVELSQKCSKDVKGKKRYENMKRCEKGGSLDASTWFQIFPNHLMMFHPFCPPTFPQLWCKLSLRFFGLRKQIPWVPLGSHGVGGHLRDLCWRPSLSGGCCLLERAQNKKIPQVTMVFNLLNQLNLLNYIIKLWLHMIKVP